MRPRPAARALLIWLAAAVLAARVGILPVDAQQATAQAVPGLKGIGDLSCAPDGSCLAVGLTPQDVGAVVVLKAGGPSGPVRPVPGTERLGSLACPAGGNCIAVGAAAGQGVVVEVARDGTPGPPRPVPGVTTLFDVACPTATTCIATGGLTVDVPAYPYVATVPRFTIIGNGQPGPTLDFPRRTGRVFGIACPSATTCLAVFPGGVVVLRHANGTWTVQLPPRTPGAAGPLEHISCSSSSICYATSAASIPSGDVFYGVPGFYGVPAIVPVSPDGVVGPVQILTTLSGTAFNISCVPGRACTVVGQSNVPPAAGLAVDVVRGAPTAITRWPEVNELSTVSCVAAATCGMAGSRANTAYFIWHGPVPS